MSDPLDTDVVFEAILQQLAALLPGMPSEDRVRFATAIRGPEPYCLGRDSIRHEGIARGTVREGVCAPGAIYPGVEHAYRVYVPAQYDGSVDAALMVFQDGTRYLGAEIDVPTVLDNLISAGDVPLIVAVFVDPGAKGPGLPIYGGKDNRSIEYDSSGDAYVRFLLEELLPQALAGLRVSAAPALRAIAGISSGGHCAFNAAWERPQAFGRVLSHCGSYTDLRGGHLLAPAVRREARRPLRVFLQTGRNDLDIVFGNWLLANQALASALEYRGYEVRLVVGDGGHSLVHGGAIFPDSLRWLWQDGPTPTEESR